MTLERMADRDVSLHREAEYQQRTEVLGGEKHDRKQLTEAGHLQEVLTPLGL